MVIVLYPFDVTSFTLPVLDNTCTGQVRMDVFVRDQLQYVTSRK